MKFWKNWPYWVRGGMIGGMLGIILGLLLLSHLNNCSHYQDIRYPEDEYASLRCPWLPIEGPGILLSIGLDQIPWINDNSIDDFENMLTVLGWAVTGIAIGTILGSTRKFFV